MGIKHTRGDLTGQRFGNLVALSFVPHKTKGSNNQSKWLCRCDCGDEKVIFRGSLLKGASTSCGCSTRKANGDARRGQIANRRTVPRLSWRKAAKHAYGIVRDFEAVIADYTGAPYAIAIDSCTNALLLACAYSKVKEVEIPKRTYVGVPHSIRNAGGKIKFREESWVGMYQLTPYPIFDAARLFTTKMYRPGTLMCLSFHWTKHLPIGRGGAILCDDKRAVVQLKKMRFDGRTEGVSPKNDVFDVLGWHVLMSPDAAAQGLMLMAGMKDHNEPLPWGPGTSSDYGDLSQQDIFK